MAVMQSISSGGRDFMPASRILAFPPFMKLAKQRVSYSRSGALSKEIVYVVRATVTP